MKIYDNITLYFVGGLGVVRGNLNLFSRDRDGFTEAQVLTNDYIRRVMETPYSLIGAGIIEGDWQDITFDGSGAPAAATYDSDVAEAAILAEFERIIAAEQWDSLGLRWGHNFGLTLESVDIGGTMTWCVKKAYDLKDVANDISEGTGANMPILSKDGLLFSSARSTKLIGDYVHAGATPIRTEMAYKLTADTLGYIYSVGGNTGLTKGWRQVARGDFGYRMQFEYRDGSASSTLNSTTNYNLNGTELVSLITWNGVTEGYITINKDGAFNAGGAAVRQWAGDSVPAYSLGCHRSGVSNFASYFTGYIKGHQINNLV